MVLRFNYRKVECLAGSPRSPTSRGFLAQKWGDRPRGLKSIKSPYQESWGLAATTLWNDLALAGFGTIWSALSSELA